MVTTRNTMTYRFEDVVAWKRAHAFVLEVYGCTREFPEEERFCLTSQFRRAAISIEANIAEGYKKMSKADKLRFFNISQGSMEECRDYIILARDLEYVTPQQFDTLRSMLEEASRMLVRYCDGILHNAAIHDDLATGGKQEARAVSSLNSL